MTTARGFTCRLNRLRPLWLSRPGSLFRLDLLTV
jgi:hypothetical protein